MIVKNEERFLAQCLESVKDHVDEICIVDTGSTDRTIEIARSYGANVEEHAWRNDFGWARDRALELAVVRVHASDPWPDPAGVGRAVVLGSDRSVLENPLWLEDEVDWLRRIDALGTPVLGVCFGAQSLSIALGGMVAKAQPPEIGWFEIDASAPVGGTWFQWHSDTFTLPAGVKGRVERPPRG